MPSPVFGAVQHRAISTPRRCWPCPRSGRRGGGAGCMTALPGGRRPAGTDAGRPGFWADERTGDRPTCSCQLRCTTYVIPGAGAGLTGCTPPAGGCPSTSDAKGAALTVRTPRPVCPDTLRCRPSRTWMAVRMQGKHAKLPRGDPATGTRAVGELDHRGNRPARRRRSWLPDRSWGPGRAVRLASACGRLPGQAGGASRACRYFA